MLVPSSGSKNVSVQLYTAMQPKLSRRLGHDLHDADAIHNMLHTLSPDALSLMIAEPGFPYSAAGSQHLPRAEQAGVAPGSAYWSGPALGDAAGAALWVQTAPAAPAVLPWTVLRVCLLQAHQLQGLQQPPEQWGGSQGPLWDPWEHGRWGKPHPLPQSCGLTPHFPLTHG